jgi:arginyl-tRNA synthetase
MEIANRVKTVVQQAIQRNHPSEIDFKNILIQETNPGFEGDYTLVLFPFVKSLKKSPEILGNEWGRLLMESQPGFFSGFNVIKGFLNLTISDHVWMEFLKKEHADDRFGYKEKSGRKVMVEYSYNNKNKILHFGHLRNNFLG